MNVITLIDWKSLALEDQIRMSGGYFDYAQYKIEDIVAAIEVLIEENNDDTPGKWGGTIGRHYSRETLAQFRAGALLLRQAAIYAQRIDCLVSDDDGEDAFHRRLTEELKDLVTPTEGEP